MTENNNTPCIEVISFGGTQEVTLADFIDYIEQDETVGMESAKRLIEGEEMTVNLDQDPEYYAEYRAIDKAALVDQYEEMAALD